ncbi:MAG TPA: hypothetical protein VEC93_22275 [Anaerolineae bacterium]|nr:hypothetical protein [Anaerolineae bacterium]
MKNTLLITLLSFCSIHAAWAQAPDKNKQDEYLSLFRRTLQYNDLGSAAYALNGYLQSGGDSTYVDSLALVYYNMNNLAGAFRLATEIQAKEPKSVTALTLLADISGRAGEVKKSLEWYEKLVEVMPSAYNYYQLATKQFILERNMECRESLGKVLADSSTAMEQKVRLDIGEGYGEDVPVLAAAMNMMGALAYKEKNTDQAKSWYQRAVNVFPNFVIAKQNLDELNKPKEKPAPAGQAKPPVKKG